MNKPDPYKVLGVKNDASPEAIKKAFHALAQRHHPDHNPGDATAVAKFEQIHDAYEYVSKKFPLIANQNCQHAPDALITEFAQQCIRADNHKSVVHVEYLRRLELRLLDRLSYDPEMAGSILLGIPALFRRAPHLAAASVHGVMCNIANGSEDVFQLQRKLPWETLKRSPELRNAIETAITLRGLPGPVRRRGAGGKGSQLDSLA